MLDRNVLKPSAGQRFRPRSILLLKSSALAVCVLLAVVISLGTLGTKTLSRAENANACPAPQAVVDDFSGPAGASPNPQLWSHQLGAGGTDGQLQAYTNSPRNASLDGNGNLAIVAIKEPIYIAGFGTFDYTSAFLNTHGHLDVCYGTVAARIKLPAAGPGLRPAFWLLGSDFATVGWPQCGEIDILDTALPTGGSSIHGAGGYDLPIYVPSDMGTDWHEYALDWRRDEITTRIDGNVFASWTPESLPPGTTWTFNDHPMYVILNMAVGSLGAMPDASTPFPATMLLDWVRYTPAK
ncbi:glycoside hydrolase family 16 protein [uncultured Mycobacterium sp.]|uniref:glycoside hydrolase family 16 protein n=1 Tax=uncultured Mycobacterium sp. TaxID=171292 RepID=UPI0035CB1FE5